MYLLDVTGHGVPAALLSVALSRVLTTRDPSSSILISETEGEGPVATTPSRVAERLNSQFPMEAQGNRFFTLAYAVLDTETRRLTYVVAGHPSPIRVRKGCSPEQLPGRGLPIGVIEARQYDEASVQLAPGDRVFFFSDGLSEAFNERGEMLEREGFVDIVGRVCDLPLDKAAAACVDEVKRWSDPVPLSDDLSLLVLEVPECG
jgi:sigma-B regulation protein RsbU (phosphoserine phosphatase)